MAKLTGIPSRGKSALASVKFRFPDPRLLFHRAAGPDRHDLQEVLPAAGFIRYSIVVMHLIVMLAVRSRCICVGIQSEVHRVHSGVLLHV